MYNPVPIGLGIERIAQGDCSCACAELLPSALNGVKLGKGNTLLDTDSFGTPASPLDLGWVSVAERPVLAYLRAVGDELPVYSDAALVPPLLGVALALGQILQSKGLPAGAIHSLQEFDTLRPIPIGSSLRTWLCLERQRERDGLRFLSFGISMDTPDGETALAIKTTLLAPGDTVPNGRTRFGEAANRSPKTSDRQEGGEMTPVRRAITQQQLTEYAAVSGDDNSLHLDAEFAAGTQFGGIIAHGMLTLAFVSEMLTASLGEPWLTSGSLRARFKGAAYPGDCVETWGRAAKSDGDSPGYSIGLRNRNTGEDLITGTAIVKIN